MNKEQINKAIAGSMGWEFDPKEAHNWTSRGRWVKPPSGELVFRHAIPDYCNDLNAMHEAERVLDLDQWDKYARLIGRHDYRRLLNATATQRAEAYLKTIGKWQQETSREDGTTEP